MLVKRRDAPQKGGVKMEEDIDELFDSSGAGDVDFSEMLLALLARDQQELFEEPDNEEGGADE